MLRWRLLLGTLLIALLIGLFWFDARSSRPGIVLVPLAVLIGLTCGRELLGMVAARGLLPLGWVVDLGIVGIVLSNVQPLFRQGGLAAESEPLATLGYPMAAFTVALLVAFCGEMRRYEGPGAVMERLALAVFALAYVGVLLSFVVQMRWLGHGRLGIAALASLVIVVKMCDVGAYTVGRLLGRHKMSPVLSPGKTIEGAAGGIAFACLGSWVAFTWLVPAITTRLSPPPTWGWLGYGLLIGIAGILGDLAESLIKRDTGRKDSSAWMPGFGGVLDLLDSVLFTAPLAYLCWAFGLVG
jgi:phosphatidate cytidylyltransferase